jgi:hypothetical protein
MKTILLLSAITLTGFQATAYTESSDSTGLPGDHFSLEGALEVFKNSASIEAFEEALNKEDNHVNNLDLNQDGQIDYLRVEDHMEGDAHALVIQAMISETEVQDVAVIEIEKTGNEEASLQIAGDEELYGPDVYAEPFQEEAKGGKGGPAPYVSSARIVVNVWFWAPVRFIFTPGYVVWISPWRWAHYPRWWKPWRPHPYRVHYGHCVHYHVHYHRVHTHRMVRAHRVYTPHRRTSVHVHTHYRSAQAQPNKTGNQAGKNTTHGGEKEAAPKVNKSDTAPADQQRAVNHNTVRSDAKQRRDNNSRSADPSGGKEKEKEKAKTNNRVKPTGKRLKPQAQPRGGQPKAAPKSGGHR